MKLKQLVSGRTFQVFLCSGTIIIQVEFKVNLTEETFYYVVKTEKLSFNSILFFMSHSPYIQNLEY